MNKCDIALGITSQVLCFDHTFCAAHSVKFNDSTVNLSFPPSSALFGVMTGEGQICSSTFTRTVNTNERMELGKNLAIRYKDRNLNWPICYGDSCCNDATWINHAMSGVSIRLDPYHLLRCYASTLPKRQTISTSSMFLKDLSHIITGNSKYKVNIAFILS